MAPYRIEIDAHQGLVTTTYFGVVTTDCIVSATREYLEHPDFDAGFRALVDLTAVTRAEMHTDDVTKVGLESPYAPGSWLALVASDDVTYGLARAFEMTVESRGRMVRVFRDRAEADAWLASAEGHP